MPISYTIDSDKGRVVVRFAGTVRDQDLFSTFHELYDDPRHRIGMPELTDCRELERAELTGAGGRGSAAERRLRTRPDVRAAAGGQPRARGISPPQNNGWTNRGNGDISSLTIQEVLA